MVTRASRTVLVVSVLLLAAMLGLFPLLNFDVWMHLSAGRYIVEHGHIPYAHPFNFTASAGQWIDQEWLSQTLLFLLYRRIGIDGLVLLKALVGALVVGLALWQAHRRRSAFPVAVALALVAVLLVRPRLTVRPHLVTLVFLSSWALLLSGWRGSCDSHERRWTPYVLVGSMVLWANLHAGFLAGLILLGIYWLEATWCWWRSEPPTKTKRAREARSLTLVLVGCVAATMVNPYGWRLWTYPFTLVTMRVYMKYIDEWTSPDLSPRFWLLYAYLMLGTVVLLVQGRKADTNVRPPAAGGRPHRSGGRAFLPDSDGTGRALCPADALIWVVFGVMALSARRHIAPFALVSAPVVAMALSRFALFKGADESGKAVRWPSGLAYVGVAVVLVLVGAWEMLSVCPHPLRPGLSERLFPTDAARFLREHSRELPRNLYNSYTWGGYLEWELWPEWSVFIDGECVVYRERIFADWDTVYLLQRGWRRALASYGVNCIIRDWGMDNPEPLLGSGEWVTVYWDDVAMVLVRRDRLSAEFLTQNDFSLTNPAWLLRYPPQDEVTYQKALGQLDQAERGFGPTGIGYRMRGELLYQRGRYQEALREFRADIALSPERARSWSSAGDCWRKLGWHEEAIECYRTALRQYPGLVTTRMNLAELYQRQGNFKAALKELHTALGLPVGDPQVGEELRARIAELEGRR